MLNACVLSELAILFLIDTSVLDGLIKILFHNLDVEKVQKFKARRPGF